MSPSARPVLDAIRSDIVEGVVPPGSALEVDVLAAAHDVSRIPVREALMTLVGEGLVEHQPRRGYSVAQLAPGELAELYEVRGTLELAALRVAVALGGPGDVDTARRAHEALARAAAAADEREYHHQSRAFHQALTRPSAMPRLLAVFDRVWDLTEPYRPMDDLAPLEAEELHDDHGRMLAAFAAGDADALLDAAAAHQQNLAARVRARPFPVLAPVRSAPVRRRPRSSAP
ncbi:GntR family transcriptional regulator [Kineococcus rhizosphaerae]|uniref:DNA-binding GntR family transcriptional regulator n=1 Tax=Kineococcus rhizosphaerae TaxID=559628 RepID=A0A2T0R676_9ACTN|nr:GntR family transcriptional regulator [Kineococcus rhizosphaerae]PRY16651.1 DNA-binding GntR family transcriptional regulator [Kineococcus rhizosphaerae]